MARLRLNKAALSEEKKALSSFRQFLPALEAKRSQLLLAERDCRDAKTAIQKQLTDLQKSVRDHLPMIAGQQSDLGACVRVRSVEMGEDYFAGVKVPKVLELTLDRESGQPLLTPHWQDRLIEALAASIDLRIRLRVEEERHAILAAALKRATQRVNLFEKILVPKAERNIKTIKTFLDEAEMAGLIRAKLAQAKRRAVMNS